MPCAYCNERRAVNTDHVVPKSKFKTNKHLAKLLGFGPNDPENLVGACFECNMRKGSLKRVPPSMADRVDYLNALMGGKPWRVWNGDPKTLYAGVA